jgi:hypothetical protein
LKVFSLLERLVVALEGLLTLDRERYAMELKSDQDAHNQVELMAREFRRHVEECQHWHVAVRTEIRRALTVQDPTEDPPLGRPH